MSQVNQIMDIDIDDINFNRVCMVPAEVEYIIYHGGCVDGFASVLCAHKYFEMLRELDTDIKLPVFYPGKFGMLPPMEDIRNKCVLICDFSYKFDILKKLMRNVKKLLILDHHKTAEEDLRMLPESNKVFRMDHSAAYITWRYFFRNVPVPRGILYVEDNDIWAKSMPYTDEFTAYVRSLPFTFDAYSKILDEELIDTEIITQGIGMTKLNNNIINKCQNHIVPSMIQINEMYYFVAYLNTTELKNEIGNKAFVTLPNINFAAMYSHNNLDNSSSFSLRSIDTSTDVSVIAKFFGGGGHRNASAIRTDIITGRLPCTMIDNNEAYSCLKSIYSDNFTINNSSTTIKINAVYLNTSIFKYQLAKYLLQTRYSTPEITVQECVSILTNMNSENIASSYDLSVIWHYDGSNRVTSYLMYYNDSSLTPIFNEYFGINSNYTNEKNIIRFTQQGLKF